MDKMDNYPTKKIQEFLTTGQAASLCSVTRNTIFKWIQAGQLAAYRTAGGHYRIAAGELEQFKTASWRPLYQPQDRSADRSRQQYCWEYNGNGKAQAACLDCAVYALRALRCYEVSKLAPGAHHARSFCNGHCKDCDYFIEMHGKAANVLVVTNDRVLTGNLLAEADRASFNLEITDCEYNCSAVVNHFKPDFVVVDCILGRDISRNISRHLTKDPRIPYVRVVFAGSKEKFLSKCDSEVFARIARPFHIGHIEKCINAVWRSDHSLASGSSSLIQSR
jgi:excisionase family DNA binding protein